MLMPLIAFRNIGAADFEASSAARFMLSTALSTSLPMPNTRIFLSTFCICAGINIFTAASLKNPSAADNLFELLLGSTDKASFNPATISSLLREEEFPVFTLFNASLTFPNKPPFDFCCEKARLTDKKASKKRIVPFIDIVFGKLILKRPYSKLIGSFNVPFKVFCPGHQFKYLFEGFR